jgi:hypothetical protein
LEFTTNLRTTFANFNTGFKKLPYLYKQPSLKKILKTSLVILITAESAYVLTAETVDIIFYNYSILLSVPLALVAGAFTVGAPQAYRKSKSANPPNCEHSKTNLIPLLLPSQQTSIIPFILLQLADSIRA